MSLKKLNYFNYFDIDSFVEGKRFLLVGLQPWKDFSTGEVLGTKAEVVIISDKTDYGESKSGVINNLYEKLIVKLPFEIDIPMNSEVKFVNLEASVYGEFRNKLSILAENIEIVSK